MTLHDESARDNLKILLIVVTVIAVCAGINFIAFAGRM